MSGEITRKSVLLECLSIMRSELKILSRNYNGHEPANGMEEAWNQARKKVTILQDMIHAMESENVRQALADWQMDVIVNGPTALELDRGNEPEMKMNEGGIDHEQNKADEH